jgi:Mrp family chromosome partitioning ATPase
VDTTNARVITEAVAPLEKLGPNRKLYVAIGLIVGLAAGLAFALLREILMLRSAAPAAQAAAAASRGSSNGPRLVASQPERARAAGQGFRPHAAASLGAAALGAAKPAGRRWRGLGEARASAAHPAQAEPEGPVAVTLPAVRSGSFARGRRRPETSAFHGTGFLTDAWDEPRSAFAVAIGEARDRLAIEEKPGANRKVIVLGLSPGAGASLVALNLALAAAREGATPILIDLAAGPASLSAAFADDAEIGAEQVISGAAGLIRAALQDDETGAFFLPRPDAPVRPAAPSSESLKSGLLDQTRRFEAVVIDAGSTADGALPYMLAEMADDLVVIAPAGMTLNQAQRLAERALGADAAKIRCIVLNEGSQGLA